MAENSQQRGGGRKGGHNNLTYVRKLPKFLQHTQQREREDLKAKFENKEEFEDDDEYDEFLGTGLADDERPQVVVTNKSKHLSESDVKQHYQKLGKLPQDKAEEVKFEEKDKREGPSVDADGRILFKTKRAHPTTTEDTTTALQSKPDTNKKQKKKKKKASTDLLSFDLE